MFDDKAFVLIVLEVGTASKLVKVGNIWSPVLDPLTVASEETVNILDVVPPAIVKPEETAVGVNPLIVLFVSASAPVNVAKVPVTGNVRAVVAVEVSVVVKAPEVVRLPPKEIVFPLLAIPVPPLIPKTTPVTLADVPITFV